MNRSQRRRALAYAIAHVPTSTARRALYSVCMGYSFGAKTKLGWGTVISVDRFNAGDGVVIRRGNSFVGPISVELADETFIGRYNRIECGDSAADATVAHMGYTRRFVTGPKSLINEGHLFDVLGTISIGRGTWVAGFSSQFLTHGASAMNRDISLGDECFVGSAVRFAPGSQIGDRVVVGMGSVVTRAIPQADVVIGGIPAKVIKDRAPNDSYQFERTW